jgi:hypothetical protein
LGYGSSVRLLEQSVDLIPEVIPLKQVRDRLDFPQQPRQRLNPAALILNNGVPSI